MFYPINPINIQSLESCPKATNAIFAINQIRDIFQIMFDKKPTSARLVTKSLARCFGRDKALKAWESYLKYEYFELIDHGFYCELIVKYWRVK